MNFCLMLEGAVLVAYVVILVGGRGMREIGWKVLGGLLGTVALGQGVAMALVVGIHVHRSIGGVDADDAALCRLISMIMMDGSS